MIPFNRYLTAALVILSIAPIAQAAVLASPVAVIAGKVGYAVVPFCAGVVRGVATYKEDRKTQLSRLVKDDILVGATTTGALMMQNVPQWDQQNSLIHNAGVTYSGSNKYYVSVNGKFQIGCDFDTEQTAQAHLDRMQGEAKSKLQKMYKEAALHFGVQLVAFPVGYAIGYNIMKLRARLQSSTKIRNFAQSL